MLGYHKYAQGATVLLGEEGGHARRDFSGDVCEEVRAVLGQIQGTPRLMASLLYGSGLRSRTREAGGECVRLRIKDLDFERRQVFVREGKEGPGADAPRSLPQPPRRRRNKTRRLYDQDLAAECACVYLCSVGSETAVEDDRHEIDAAARRIGVEAVVPGVREGAGRPDGTVEGGGDVVLGRQVGHLAPREIQATGRHAHQR